MEEKELKSGDMPVEDVTENNVSEKISEEAAESENTDTAADEDNTAENDGNSADVEKSETAVGNDDYVIDSGETEIETAGEKESIIDAGKKTLQKMGIPDMLLSRLIAVFFLISGMNLSEIMFAEEGAINPVAEWGNYVSKVSMPLTLILMASIFVFMTLIHCIMPKKLRILDQLGAIASILYFDLKLLWKASATGFGINIGTSDSFYLTLGIAIVSAVLIFYCINKIKYHSTLNSIPWWIYGLLVLAAATGVTIFVSITTVCNHRCFGTACHDFGLFVQMYHSLIDNGTAITTCEREYTISHFKIHASYIFYALVPVFKMFPKAETLLIAQAVLAMGGVVPMFLIAKRHNFKGLSLCFMGLAYVFCIGVVAPCYYEFHENAFLPTILMWLLWAVDRKNYIMFYLMSVLTCIVKEDAPLYVVCIGIYLFFEDRESIRRVNGLIMALFAGAYMLFITNWLTQNGDGQMMMGSRFGILMTGDDSGLTDVVRNSFLNPAYLFSLLLRETTMKFFLQVMASMLFIPFFTKKIRRFMLMVPFIVMNLVIGAGYGYAANVGFQYIFGPVCLLLYMCIINVDDMGQNGKQTIPVVLGSVALIMTFSNSSHKWNNYTGYINGRDYFDSLEEMLDSIPDDASVGTDTFIIPHLGQHDKLYIFDSNDINEDGTIKNMEWYDFMAIPVRNDMYATYNETLLKNGYAPWAEIEGKFKIYVSPAYSG